MNDAHRFLEEVKRRFRKLFQASKEGYNLPDIERHRLAGFIQAGVFLGFASNTEMQALMDNVHVSVFGKTIRERKESLPMSWSDESVDYGQYDQPSFERLKE